MSFQGKQKCLAALALALSGCATARVPLFGRPVEVKPTAGHKDEAAKGELLAVGPEQLWVLEPTRVREVPFGDVEQVRVRLHGFDGQKAGAWAVAGAVLTGAALAVACGKAESENCGAAFGLTMVPWALFGGPSALSLERSSRVLVRGPEFTALRPYARYPQGWPEGLDPALLLRKTQGQPPR